jgi:hypothetical protein
LQKKLPAFKSKNEVKKVKKNDEFVTPKFLTPEIAALAVRTAIEAVIGESSPLKAMMKRLQFHIVVLVPAMKDDREADYPDWPNYPVEPHCIYEHSVGNPKEWEAPFDNIAKCKALQLWTKRNDDRTGVIPHLLFPGDTPYWGGVDRSGIVVACSGVQPWFDKMISGIVADIIVALAHDAYEKYKVENPDIDFLD